MNPFKTVFAVLLLSTFAGEGVATDLETYATGLNNPRGLKFGPDGDLYVAEGGTTVGSASTVGLCRPSAISSGTVYRRIHLTHLAN